MALEVPSTITRSTVPGCDGKSEPIKAFFFVKGPRKAVQWGSLANLELADLGYEYILTCRYLSDHTHHFG